MGRVIARVVSGTWLAHAISVILTTIFAIAVLTVQNVDLLIMIMVVLASIAIVATIIIILPRTVVVTFTEGELLVSGRRGGFSLPKSVVVTGNVICIRRGPKPILSVTYESFDYTIPLSQREYDRLVNGLTTHWGWVPPDYPST